ncbi:MAG: SDR family NAD(P)-dependent oxidoreductase [Planctomycetota bacterium]|jgi:NAD(P)-dependent dehydrogenase (short-subunit alcohol dehydrogenase family)
MHSKSLSTIVTGSSSGIGREIARAFLAAGHRVVLHGRDATKLAAVEAELAASAPDAAERLASATGDIGDARTGEALARTAVERFGSVDVLVNNAGVFGAKPFLDVTEAELDGYLQGNLKGTYLTTQAAVREMQRGGGGSIVNIGTVLIDHALSGVPASAPLVSKGGVHALTKTLSAELAADGIRVNLVAPGMVRTPLHPEENVDALCDVALLKRVGEAHEIADAVLFLATSEFTTGHILNVDGGFVTGRA